MVWKLSIITFFISKVGFSVFSLANINFFTNNSIYGCINIAFAFLIKGI